MHVLYELHPPGALYAGRTERGDGVRDDDVVDGQVHLGHPHRVPGSPLLPADDGQV